MDEQDVLVEEMLFEQDAGEGTQVQPVNTNLPHNWQRVRLGDLLENERISLTNGFAQGGYNESGQGVPHLRPFNVTEDGRIDLSQIKSVEPPREDSSYWVHPGDVIFNNTNSEELVGKTAYFAHSGRFVLSNHMTLIRILDSQTLDALWFANEFQYLWRRRVFQALCRRHVNQASVSLERLKGITIPLPPLQEQRAIAHILRTVQEAIQARRREADLERECKAALMQHLFTCGTRGEPRKQTEIGEMPESWQISSLGEICSFLQYGTSERCDADASGIPVLRIPNVIDGRVDLSDLKYAKLPANTVQGLKLETGDVLFVRTNGRREYTGRCAVFNGELKEALFASYLIRARLKPTTALPGFVRLYSETHEGRSFLSGKASNAADGKFNINTQTIKGVIVPLPTISEQQEIVDALNACDTKIAALEQEAMLIGELFRALLEELMTGRLSIASLIAVEVAHE
ncbi:MAG TPA: restriction endonuclease subunit S [Ktedonobacterales bacterium]|jgi:type I restriction enzyme S subunit